MRKEKAVDIGIGTKRGRLACKPNYLGAGAWVQRSTRATHPW